MEESLPKVSGSRSLVLPLTLILLGVILGGGYFYLSTVYPAVFATIKELPQRLLSSRTDRNPAKSPSPPPAGLVVSLPSGPQTYKFSHGKEVLGPKTSELTLDPLTPQNGQTQTLTLQASHTSPITSVSVEVITDNQTTPHALTQSSGDELDGTWSGSWTIDDSYDYTYGLRLMLSSADHNYDNTMWFR